MAGRGQSIGALILGMVTIVIGLILSTIVNSQAATSGAAANIGSFSGAQSMNDLVPLVFIVAIVMLGVGLMGIGAAGALGFGPTAGGGRRGRR